VRGKRFVYTKEKATYYQYHRHKFYSIELILSGNCQQDINGYPYECSPGTICLLSPFDYHTFHLSDSDVSTYCLSFSENVLTKEVLYALNNTWTPCVMEVCHISEDIQTIETEISEAKPLYLSAVNAIVNKLVIYLLRNAASDPFPFGSHKSEVRNSIAYIRSHFHEPITLEEVANAVNVTPNHFCKYFKKITGTTFKDFLLELRLEYAMQQILLTSDSITDICFESGFNSTSYFAKSFKALFGKSPTAFRSEYFMQMHGLSTKQHFIPG
jgi:AraC-like DNA-binding protein